MCGFIDIEVVPKSFYSIYHNNTISLVWEEKNEILPGLFWTSERAELLVKEYYEVQTWFFGICLNGVPKHYVFDNFRSMRLSVIETNEKQGPKPTRIG